jgi:hypothetical protein
MAGCDRAQHKPLPEPVHQPALCDRSERAGEAEGTEDPAGLSERAGRVARQQQDAEPEHPDRDRAGDREQDGRSGARQGQQRPIPMHSRQSYSVARRVERHGGREFRAAAEASGLRHFLELFAPNVPPGAPDDPGRFLNDFVPRTLAAVPRASRPLFLKLPYFGGEVMRELAAYDPQLIPGILGGASGTTYDAFFLLSSPRRPERPAASQRRYAVTARQRYAPARLKTSRRAGSCG